MPSTKPQLNLRVPEVVRNRLADWAARSEQSLNAAAAAAISSGLDTLDRSQGILGDAADDVYLLEGATTNGATSTVVSPESASTALPEVAPDEGPFRVRDRLVMNLDDATCTHGKSREKFCSACAQSRV